MARAVLLLTTRTNRSGCSTAKSPGLAPRVCGDAKRMAGDVDLALQQIAVTQGGMDATAAKRYLADLGRAGRYQRDVY